MCASTAEVGSTSTRISGSADSARASTSRCRWPPEKLRPRSATIGVEALGQRLEDVAGGRGVERALDLAEAGDVEPVAEPTGEEQRAGVGHQDPAAYLVRGQRGERYVAEA